MKKTERLNGVIFALKERGRLTAKDLSTMFEVSERTIYRDIDALSQLKVPIIAFDGLGGGYEINPDYFIPSIKLTEDEAIILLMILKLGEAVRLPNYKSDYSLLKSKIVNTIEGVNAQEIDGLLGRISFHVSDVIPKGYDKGIMATIIKAFLRKKQPSFTYYTPAKDVYVERRVSPQDLHFDAGGWYLSAYCHLRAEKRIFRLDRMTKISEVDYNNKHLDVVLNSSNDQYALKSYVLTIEESLYRVLKDNFYFVDSDILEKGSWIKLALRTTHERVIRQLVLEHPDKITILTPDGFMQDIKANIIKLYQKYI